MSAGEREKSREDSMCNDLFPSAAQNPLHRDFLLSFFFTLLLIYLGTLHDGVSFWMFRIPFGIELFVQLSRLAFHFSCCARCSYQSISEEIKCKLIAFLPNFLFSLSLPPLICPLFRVGLEQNWKFADSPRERSERNHLSNFLLNQRRN